MGAIDICVGLQTPETVKLRPDWAKRFFEGTFKAANSTVQGVPLADYVDIMDEADVDVSLLFSPKAGPKHEPTSYRPDPKIVARAVESYPDRFRGLIGLDPTKPMQALAELEYAVSSLGFIGAHIYPHWFGLPPDDALWYPIYAKCCELDIPIQMQVGHCLLYTSEKPLRSVGRPITLDKIACDFPDLKVIGIHTGWPWAEEMVAIAYKHPNVYIGTDAYSPKHLDSKLVHYMNTFGNKKVLFGTDYPVIDPRRAVSEFSSLELRDASLKMILSENARRVYALDN
ncbi:amidohydrolase family protein [Nesterenkonia populi]|uniref:amidohydrolase family protein n=1 Tax=Nesterenkonia populi TaxID=1591087 RepID=UPI0011BEF923|nr:amidohydrolase family protein [Nesterenkonia populi]